MFCQTESGGRVGRIEVRKGSGFSLVELAIVLVVVGVLLAAGVTAWRSVVETRKITKSASVLYQVRDCLIRRMAFSERYPTYTPNLAFDCSNADPMLDVDNCTCGTGVTDAWGRRVLYIEGLNASDPSGSGGPLRNMHLVTDSAKNMSRNETHADSDATDHKGTVREDVAFILLSLGEDGAPCDAAGGTCSYNLFGGDLIGTLSGYNPDFQDQDDDVYLIVTSQEIMGEIR